MMRKGGRRDRGQVFLPCSLSALRLWLIPAGGRGGLSLGFCHTIFSPCPLRTRASCYCSSPDASTSLVGPTRLSLLGEAPSFKS